MADAAEAAGKRRAKADPETLACFACGGEVPDTDGKTPDHLISSPGCWATFGKILRREYQKPGYRENHRLTVDAYTVQHPPARSPEAARQMALRLIGLCAVLERGTTQGEVSRTLEWLSQQGPEYEWLPPPPPKRRGDVTAADVVKARSAESHLDMVEVWARSAWKAWARHHDRVRSWLKGLM